MAEIIFQDNHGTVIASVQQAVILGGVMTPLKEKNEPTDDNDVQEAQVVETLPAPAPAEPKPELFKYIHYSVTEEAEREKVDKMVRNIVKMPMAALCASLKELAKEKKTHIFAIQPALAFEELHRMGMPGEDEIGYGYKNFTKYFC